MTGYFKGKEVECFNYGCLGHVFTNCPSPEDIKKSMQVTQRDVNSNKGDSMTSKDHIYEQNDFLAFVASIESMHETDSEHVY